MKSFVVIGIGRFGLNLARTLAEDGYEVLAIDSDEDRIQRVADSVTHAAVGDVRDEGVLKSLGVRNFDCAVISLSDDVESSVLVTMMLKELGVRYVVAKASSDLHMRVLLKVGADKVVFPEKDMSVRLAAALTHSNMLEYIEMSRDFSMAEINVPEKWINKSLIMINPRKYFGINVIALKKAGAQHIEINVNPEYTFKHGDTVMVVGETENVEGLSK